MGKKSSTKKQRAAQSGKKQMASETKAHQGIALASLSGTEPAAASAAAKPLGFGEQTQYVRSDIARIGLLIATVAVLLVAAAVWNGKGTSLSILGSHLAAFMRLQ